VIIVQRGLSLPPDAGESESREHTSRHDSVGRKLRRSLPTYNTDSRTETDGHSKGVTIGCRSHYSRIKLDQDVTAIKQRMEVSN
jgi:hypothetical protein